jgi:hypothetical protein
MARRAVDLPRVEISTLNLREAMREIIEAAALTVSHKQGLARLLGVRRRDLAQVIRATGARV